MEDHLHVTLRNPDSPGPGDLVRWVVRTSEGEIHEVGFVASCDEEFYNVRTARGETRCIPVRDVHAR